MKQINEMNEAELTEYIVEMKKRGLSAREIDNIYNRFNIPNETRARIRERLQELDMLLKQQKELAEKKTMGQHSIINLILGIFFFIIGCVIYKLTAQAGRFYMINFLFWLAGVVYVGRAIILLVKSKS